MKTFTKLALAGLGLTASSLASAQITSYDFFRTQYNTQTASDTAPTVPDYIQMNARVFSTNPGDVTDFTLTDPMGNVYDNNGSYSFSGGYENNFLSGGYTSQAAEEAAFPTGNYTYSVTGSQAGTAVMTVPKTSFADAVPYFTGASFNNMQNAVAGQSINVVWNTFTNSDPSAALYTYLYLYDSTTGNTVYTNYGTAASYGSDTLAGSLLTAGDSYSAELFFSSRYFNQTVSTTGGFTTGGLVAFDLETQVQFTAQAVPEPFSMTLLGLGAVALMRRRKI